MREDGDELHASCLLEESENEQWHEVTSKRTKLKLKKLAHELLLSVENNLACLQGKALKSLGIGKTPGPLWTHELQGTSCLQRCSRE